MPLSQTKRSTRKLSEVARHVVIPSGIVTSGWAPVEERCREFGDEFDEWQRGAGKVMLGKRENGEYAATVGGITLSIPRQVAKTFLVLRIIVALCTLFPNMTVLWSAHRTRTASKTFGTLRGMVGRKAVAPYVKSVRSVNGEQEVHFTNGSVIMFGAREQGFGRGFDEVDIEVFDEAQILTEKALEDMVAATNQSRFPAGALLFFMGTPPRPVDPSEAFKARRREALETEAAVRRGEVVESDAVYIECSADPDADPDDREQWAIANPSYPHRTPLRSMLRLRKNLPGDASWKREALGIWDSDQEGSRAIAEHEWLATGVDVAPAEGVRSFSVAFSFDGSRLALSGGLKHDDGIHVELIDAAEGDIASGLSALADWLAERWRHVAVIVLSGAAGAPVLAQLLKDRRVPDVVVKVATTTEYMQSCSMTLDAVRDSASAAKRNADLDRTDALEPLAFTHLTAEGQAQLDASVGVCDKKQRGTAGAWAWYATTPEGDETPVESMSLAYWAAKTTRRKPRGDQERKAVIL
ncbi:terminase [Cryobacterium sp. BB736]|uniref:terminase n=1 Tax=Cryobacterium sp. BB736 TaxID=2746963 RepID=UPI001874B406|nr:terminase [Cryobacterium sp. BB736]